MANNTLKNQKDNSVISRFDSNNFTITPIEKDIIKKAVNGDEKSFEMIFMGTYRYVFATVHRYLKNDQDIYDAIQDTYLRVYRGISKLEEIDSFYPWLHRIAENCAKDILATYNKTTVSIYDNKDEISQEDKSGKTDICADITEVLKQLPSEQTELLILVYYDKMRISEIARMQNIPKTTLHNRLKAAKKKLKELLKIRGIDKPIYGGEFVSVMSSAIRNAIGTELLSMAVAEEILHNITHSHNPKGAFVISAFARKARNTAAKKIASTLILVSVFVSAIALLIIGLLTNAFNLPAGNDNLNSSTNLLGNTAYSSSLYENNSTSKSPSEVLSSNISSYAFSTSSYDFYFSIMKDDVRLKGSFTNTEVFGTHTENEELDIAIVGDTLYAVVKNNLVSLKNGSATPTLLIKNFGVLYTDSSKCLNIYNNKVYWVNENSAGDFVLNRCNIDGSEHYSVIFGDTNCTYLTKLLVAKDGVYFCAGKHGDYSYTKSGTLYRTDYNFNIINKQESIADYTLLNDKIFVLYGKGNGGMPFSMNRATFTNLINISEDHLSYSSIYSFGDYIVLDAQSPYMHSEYAVGHDLKVMDTTQNKIVRAIYGEGGYIIDIKDINEADGTILYRFNDKSMTLNIKTNETAVVSNHNGTTIKSNKYFIENDSLYFGNIQGTTKKKNY